MTTSRGIVRRNLEEISEKISSLSVAELAYAAGLFDGEGCVATYTKKNRVQFSYAANIANTDYRVLAWLLDKFGGKVTKRGGVRASNQRHKECYVWYVMNGRAAAFMAAVRPYTVIKSEQIDLALELRTTCRFDLRGQVIPPDVLERRRDIMQRIKAKKRAVYGS
ncbi:hypothetical protein [Nitrospira sp. BLG_2]|uniref:hypothetical protein n=1 Tax=Nitrospira sp. BLG_2 TaxID=3397507 RepID=UPI003B9A2EC0